MLRPGPTFWGAVVPKRIATYQKKLSRHERTSAAVVHRKLLRKLALLFNHYGIADKNDMPALAWALAFEHVPGFKVKFPEGKSKRGRKLKWNPDRLAELRQTVQSIKQQHHFTDRHALTFIVNNSQYAATWGIPKGHKGSKKQWIETLEARLQDAKRFERSIEQAERELKAIAASTKFRK